MRSLKSILREVLVKEKGPEPFSGVGTVFLSDASFKNIEEGIDPEALATAMNSNFAATHRLIEESGGLIVDSTGDAVLAVWVPSFVKPSHAELAFDCARKILKQMQENQGKSRLTTSLRIVLATGKLAGRSIGGRFQVFGDPLAVAKRLEGLKPRKHGRVICTSETLAYIPGAQPAEPVGHVKGVSGQDVPVFEFS
jgi:class 3 adenylate cyclase